MIGSGLPSEKSQSWFRRKVFLTAKSILELSGWSEEVEPDVLGGGSGEEEGGESDELHGEAGVDTGLISTPLLPFIRRDKQRFVRVSSLSGKGAKKQKTKKS